MASKFFPESRKQGIIVQELEGEVLIYDLQVNKAHCLNKTSALVWNLCDGKHSISDIGKQLSGRFAAAVTEDFVFFALEQLKKKNLLLNGKESETIFEGLSRREIIRKVGIGSFVALPVIASLVAPVAAQVQSRCGCANPGQCLTQTTCPSTVNCNPSRVCAP
jgi:hypothetical protein